METSNHSQFAEEKTLNQKVIDAVKGHLETHINYFDFELLFDRSICRKEILKCLEELRSNGQYPGISNTLLKQARQD